MKEDLGLDFVGDSQMDITPFQRQVYEAEQARKARAKQEQMPNDMGGGGGGRTPNSRNNQSPGDSDLSRSETVRYVNESPDGDDETLTVTD